jgi:hypothetical protein
MSYLHAKLRRIEEANYINRLMKGAPSAPDLPGYVHFNEPPPKKPDDIVYVWCMGDDGLLHKTAITQAQFDADFEAMLAKNREEIEQGRIA